MLLRTMLASSLILGGSAFAADPPPAPAPASPAAPAPPTLVPGGTIVQGTVILNRRSPVVGAAVVIRPQDAVDRIAVTATDAKGNFRLDSVRDGSYRLDVTRDGYQPVVKDNVTVKAPFRAVVEIVMEPAAAGAAKPAAAAKTEPATAPVRLSGVATTREGGPKGEVQIRVQRADGGAEPRTVLSAPDGTFALEGLSAGSWRIEILGAGYLPIRVAVDLATDARMLALLVPQPMNYTPPPEDLLPPEEAIPPKEPLRAPVPVDEPPR